MITKQQWFEAAREGRLDVIKKAVEEGFDVNTRSSPTYTAICYALDKPEMLRYLLRHGATLDNVLIDGHSTLLQHACDLGAFESIRILVEEAHVDVNETPTGGFSPLGLAAYHNRFVDCHEIVEYLLEHGAAATPGDCRNACSVDELKRYFEHLEATPEIVKELLKKCAVDSGTRTGHLDKFRFLAELYPKKIKFNGKFGMELLCLAVGDSGGSKVRCSMMGKERIIEYLCRNGVDVRSDKFRARPFLAAVNAGNRFAAKLLRKLGADTACCDDDGRNALHLAAEGGRLDLVEFVVEECGIDVNSRDRAGKTAAHYAADRNREVDILRYLVDERGADLTIRDDYGETPGEHRQLEAIRLFVHAPTP